VSREYVIKETKGVSVNTLKTFFVTYGRLLQLWKICFVFFWYARYLSNWFGSCVKFWDSLIYYYYEC
jgi:hypothetical protein